jgi:hypothetical protein
MTTLYRLLWRAFERYGWLPGTQRFAPWLFGKMIGSKGVRVDREEL